MRLLPPSTITILKVGENQRGRFIRINESGGGYAAGGSSLMFPSGFNGCYLLLFKECMLKVRLCGAVHYCGSGAGGALFACMHMP